MATEVRVPALGESVSEATVANWTKKVGDAVSVDEMLCELETDKVTVEAPAPVAGVITEIVAAEGATVAAGGLLAMIDEGASAGAGAPAAPQAAPVAAPAPSGGGEEMEVKVPTLGESVTSATVGAWLKNPGDKVAQDELLVELETDKVTVEVMAPVAGVFAAVVASEGSTVEVGATLAKIDPSGEGAASAPAPVAAAAAASGGADIKNAPSAEKLMAEKGLSPDQVQGTGRDGRIMKEDVQRAGSGATQGASGGAAAAAGLAAAGAAVASGVAPKAPAKPSGAAGDREKRVRMTRLRQTIAKRLKDAQNTAAMLTTYNEVDMTNVMALRSEYKELFEKKHGVKLGFMSFFVKACTHALKELPAVNAEIDGDEMVYKNYYNIGVAVGTPNGLVVPVIRDADEMGFADIEKTIGDFGVRARDGKLGIAEMQGGTFTISNGGVYGSLMSSPILNPPQSAILGMHKIQQRPMVIDGEIVARPMMYLALSYDHRIIDGKEAVTFLVRVKDAIEDPRRLLMDL